MKIALAFSALLVLSLSACNGPDADTSGKTADGSAAPKAATAPTKRSGRLSAEQLKQIEASGKTGLWTDPAEICSNRHKGRASVMLAWNVQATGPKNITVHLVERNGNERRVASGSAVGGRVTGPWVRPGTTFVLRAPDKSELSKVVVGGKKC